MNNSINNIKINYHFYNKNNRTHMINHNKNNKTHILKTKTQHYFYFKHSHIVQNVFYTFMKYNTCQIIMDKN